MRGGRLCVLREDAKIEKRSETETDMNFDVVAIAA